MPARFKVAARRSDQLLSLSPKSANRRLISTDQLRLPSPTNKAVNPIRRSSAGVQSHPLSWFSGGRPFRWALGRPEPPRPHSQLRFPTVRPRSVRARESCLEDFLGGMGSGTGRRSSQLASHLASKRPCGFSPYLSRLQKIYRLQYLKLRLELLCSGLL
jgi:hypothetical protein